MRKKPVAAVLLLALAGCASQPQNADSAIAVQMTTVQACAAYGAVFTTALSLRKMNKLNPSQIQQITLLDNQITPICTGNLPADSTEAVAKVTGAVTALTAIELALKAN